MEKIAIISDIHGNLEALKTVINDIKKRNITHIYCLGDIIGKGSHAHECIKLVRENCEVVIKGNNDEIFTCENFYSDNPDYIKRRKWNETLLTKEDVSYLKKLPFSYEFYMSGSLVRLFHATPYKINDFCSSFDKLTTKYKMFLPSNNTITDKKADVIIYGHTHTSYIERIYNRTLINVNSVGNPMELFHNDLKDASNNETTRANYLILEGELNSTSYTSSFSYQFILVPYDIDKELKTQKDNIEFDSYTLELKEGRYRDMTKTYEDFKNKGLDITEI